ncbi:hypothetical protein AB4Y63_12045 [Leifsonia sp. YAF41]|uniref:hypothetical protein n=1 Tax=Leifsonia sp. YAF41 TaxID=3233086 RepID=UPI003F9A3B44
MIEHSLETTDELPTGASGTWRVYTRDSCHVFNFEQGTVTREPGPNTYGMFNDQPLPLRSIDICRVGERGRWTMHTIGWSDDIDWYWVDTSVVREIVKDDASESPETNHELEQ